MYRAPKLPESKKEIPVQEIESGNIASAAADKKATKKTVLTGTISIILIFSAIVSIMLYNDSQNLPEGIVPEKIDIHNAKQDMRRLRKFRQTGTVQSASDNTQTSNVQSAPFSEAERVRVTAEVLGKLADAYVLQYREMNEDEQKAFLEKCDRQFEKSKKRFYSMSASEKQKRINIAVNSDNRQIFRNTLNKTLDKCTPEERADFAPLVKKILDFAESIR